jgi:hypothetical protein
METEISINKICIGRDHDPERSMHWRSKLEKLKNALGKTEKSAR